MKLLPIITNETEWTAIERVQWHLEAIECVRTQLRSAAYDGDLLAYKYAGERLMSLEYSLVSETSRLADHLNKTA